MSETRLRLERAMARLEAVASRPAAPAPSAGQAELEARCARLESATREAIARIDRLLSAG